MRPASPPLTMTDGQRDILEKLAKSHTAPHRDVTRAKALLLAGKGAANTAIAWELGVSASSVTSWRNRFEEEGLKKFGKVKSGCSTEMSRRLQLEGVVRLVHRVPNHVIRTCLEPSGR
jgi:transposase